MLDFNKIIVSNPGNQKASAAGGWQGSVKVMALIVAKVRCVADC